MNLEQHISALLYNHDCVIVPGFGGFVGNYQPASVHPTLHVFNPPSKHIVFNRNVKSNDGLLANEIVVSDKLNYNEAIKAIENYVQSVEKTLGEGKKVTIEKVGNLYYDIEKTLQFEADTSVNYLLDSYGLSNVQSFPIKRDVIYIGRELKSKDRPVEEIHINKFNYRKHIWKAAVLVPIIGLGIWISLNIQTLEKKHISWSSLNPFKSSTEEVVTPEKVDITPIVPISVLIERKKASSIDNKAVSKEITPDKKEVVTINPQPKEEIKPQPIATSNGSYYIIGGCFGVMENANRYVNELKAKGYNASVCGQNANGLNMVAYDSFSTEEEANQVIKEIRQQNPNAWVFVKR